MTQIDELVKRARRTRVQTAFHRELADALEAQAARVKVLESGIDTINRNCVGLENYMEELRSRIATLEAQLKAFREAARLVGEQSTHPTDAGARLVGVQAWDALISALRNTETKDDDAQTMDDVLREAEARILRISEKHDGHIKSAHTGVAVALSKLRSALK